MRKEITIVAEPRSSRGKNEARRMRAAGSAPAVVYGAAGESVAVAVSPKEVNRILHRDRKSTRLNSSHGYISYAVFCLKKKKIQRSTDRSVYDRPSLFHAQLD